jgi:hypothetical protein
MASADISPDRLVVDALLFVLAQLLCARLRYAPHAPPSLSCAEKGRLRPWSPYLPRISLHCASP